MSFKTFMPVAAIVSLGLMTAACGNNPTDRALTGGAVLHPDIWTQGRG